MIPSYFKIEIFAIHTKYSGSGTNGLTPSCAGHQHILPEIVICVLFLNCLNRCEEEVCSQMNRSAVPANFKEANIVVNGTQRHGKNAIVWNT